MSQEWAHMHGKERPLGPYFPRGPIGIYVVHGPRVGLYTWAHSRHIKINGLWGIGIRSTLSWVLNPYTIKIDQMFEKTVAGDFIVSGFCIRSHKWAQKIAVDIHGSRVGLKERMGPGWAHKHTWAQGVGL